MLPAHSREGDLRIKWVDVAKSLGLFLVFWGHLLYGGSSVAGVMNRAIYSFHMPMYFILSGYVVKNDTQPFIDYLRNKACRILLPAVLCYVLTIPIYFYYLDYSTITLKRIAFDLFYIQGDCAYNKPVWFFFCLFQILIVERIARLSRSGNMKLLVVLLLSLLIGYVCYASGWEWFSLFGFNRFIIGLFFFVFGMLLRRLETVNYNLLGVICLPIWVLTGVVLNPKVSMYTVNFGSFGLFVIAAITGSLAFFVLCQKLESIERIQWNTKWTIFIVCSHYVLVTLFTIFSFRISILGTILFDIASAIFVLVALLLYNPLCEWLDVRFPILFGDYQDAKNHKRNK